MTVDISETADIVGMVCAIDNRNVSDKMIDTWHKIIGHLPAREAATAFKIVASRQTGLIKPAHILEARSTARAQIERETRRGSHAIDGPTGMITHSITPRRAGL